jgi:hypothetical protein
MSHLTFFHGFFTVLRIRIRSGSTCFWASRIRIYLSEIWIRILLPPCKNMKKTLDSYFFVTLFDFLSFKNDVNVPSKSNKQKNLLQKLVFFDILKVHDENSRILIQDRDPDPLFTDMDPRIRIRIVTKMSWICSTGFSTPFFNSLLWRCSSDEWVFTEAAGVRMLDLGLLKKGKIYSKVLSFCNFLSFTYMPFSLLCKHRKLKITSGLNQKILINFLMKLGKNISKTRMNRFLVIRDCCRISS